MAPKKREKDSTGKRENTNDHELFLQAFEKPTQIYKYLKSRSKFSPIFLNRTLTYMPKRQRSKHSRCFNINNLLRRLEYMKTETSTQISTNPGFLTITYLGFYNKEHEQLYKEPVKVETLLLKICHKKRKDTSCPVMTVSFGTVYAPSNPSNDGIASKSTVSIPTASFNLTNGHIVKSYHLLLRVSTAHSNGLTVHKDSAVIQRKRKLSGKEDENNLYNGTANGGDSFVNNNNNGSNNNNNNFNGQQYGTNLIVYDKQNRCLLPDGEYQLLLHELSSNCPANKLSHLSSSWETIPIKETEEKTVGFERYTIGPTLRFRLHWTKDANLDFNGKIRNGEYLSNYKDSNYRLDMSKLHYRNEDINQLGYKVKIVYQFLYNDNSRQQTEASEDLHCPWCSLECYTLYTLLKHLKLCHSRFTFSYVPTPIGARIDVAINEQYDGSYLCGARDASNGSSVGYAFPRSGPVRRACSSNIIVCHPKRPRRPSLSEFINEVEENENYDSQRPFVTGHNRLYHHTSTSLPIHPKEMDKDSEDEGDPKWLQKKTQMMIDDFTDVNDGEKELMKMWNLHVMKYGFVGDCQIPLACSMFLENRGKELLSKNLYRNFVLHMCNLFDFGLVSPVTVYTTVQRLQELIGNNTDVSKILHEAWNTQRKYWISNESVRRATKSSSTAAAATSFSSFGCGNVNIKTTAATYQKLSNDS